MIADALRHDIELHAERVRDNNRFLRLARAGRAEPEAVGRYLIVLRFLLGNTSDNLRRAGRRATEIGRPDLATFYLDKIEEEEGHDQWAIDDLAVFAETYGFRPDPTVVPAARDLQSFVVRIIDADPILYLSYLFWAEYFVVLVGGEFAEYLVTRCGLPPAALSCLTKHVALDEDHTDDDMAAIDALVTEPRYLPPMRKALRQTMDLFEAATEQMVDGDTVTERVAS